MLELRNIIKDYDVGNEKVRALKGVSLAFRKNEMVSILGQSGCGKTTLLNIIGGLDRYTSGDLIISGRSTKYFKPSDWDAYRNQKIGFVFQSYNLIPHLTVLGNVELALTLSGVKKAERRARAAEALKMVGLESELKKRPNQMSGGQMQRVAIARALVNNPDIVLADEPTGALDSTTSVAILEILKEIARDRLVIMVTHNQALAETYSTRIISMLDGEVVGDTSPVPFSSEAPEGGESEARAEKIAPEADDVSDGDGQGAEATESVPARDKKERTDSERAADEKLVKKAEKRRQKEITKSNRAALKRTSMSVFTAFGLSLRNLITKKGRTIATSIAGSIGIIGVALVLALANGFNAYIADMQTSMLAHYPVTATDVTVDMKTAMESMENMTAKFEEFPDGNKIIIKPDSVTAPFHYNRITEDFLRHVEKMPSGLAIDVTYSYGRTMPIMSANTSRGYGFVNTNSSSMNSMLGMSSSLFQQLLNNSEYVRSQYDVLTGKYPTGANEIALLIGTDNAINASTVRSVGLKLPDGFQPTSGKPFEAKFEDFIGQELKLINNNEWFTLGDDGIYREFSQSSSQSAMAELYAEPNNTTLKIVGVMRVKETAALALFSSGIVYTPALTEQYMETCRNSDVAIAQKASTDRYISNASTTSLTTLLSVVGSTTGSPVNYTGEMFNGAEFQKVYTISKSLKINLTETDMYNQACSAVGATDMPSGLNFYPVSFAKKTDMINYISKYNSGRTEDEEILVLDASSMVTETVSDMIDIISYVLVAFAAISLVVSSVMISIITYASVAERIKEIGVLRAVGARRADIMRVFIAETVMIGFAAGVIGVLVTLILSFPLSSLFINISDGVVTTALVSVAWWHALLLIGVSVFLTFLAGMLPARSAARRDPVAALRSE